MTPFNIGCQPTADMCIYRSDRQCNTLAVGDNWPLITGQLDVLDAYMHDRDHHTHKPDTLNMESYLYRGGILELCNPRNMIASHPAYSMLSPPLNLHIR